MCLHIIRTISDRLCLKYKDCFLFLNVEFNSLVSGLQISILISKIESLFVKFPEILISITFQQFYRIHQSSEFALRKSGFL